MQAVLVKLPAAGVSIAALTGNANINSDTGRQAGPREIVHKMYLPKPCCRLLMVLCDLRMSASWPVVARCFSPLPPPGTSWPQIKMAGTILLPVTASTISIIIDPSASLFTSKLWNWVPMSSRVFYESNNCFVKFYADVSHLCNGAV